MISEEAVVTSEEAGVEAKDTEDPLSVETAVSAEGRAEDDEEISTTGEDILLIAVDCPPHC